MIVGGEVRKFSPRPGFEPAFEYLPRLIVRGGKAFGSVTLVIQGREPRKKERDWLWLESSAGLLVRVSHH